MMMYKRKCRLSKAKQYKLIELFVAGATVQTVGKWTGVHVNTATRFFMSLRRLITSQQPDLVLSGKVEVGESFFGGFLKSKWGQGAAGKTTVFGGVSGAERYMLVSSRMSKRRR